MFRKGKTAATKRVQGLGHLPYEDRLVHLSLPTVDERRLRGDLVETYDYDQKRGSQSRTFLPAVILWVQLERSQLWNCRNSEPVLMSGNSSSVSVRWKSGICYHKTSWMLPLWTSSRTVWTSSGKNMGIKSTSSNNQPITGQVQLSNSPNQPNNRMSAVILTTLKRWMPHPSTPWQHC